jgi:hypothetical protein
MFKFIDHVAVHCSDLGRGGGYQEYPRVTR